VRRGVAERHPKKYALDEAEINRVSKLARVPPEEMAKEMARLQAELANAKGDDEEELNVEDEDNEAECVCNLRNILGLNLCQCGCNRRCHG
jgi:periodic tryptophan protein 1